MTDIPIGFNRPSKAESLDLHALAGWAVLSNAKCPAQQSPAILIHPIAPSRIFYASPLRPPQCSSRSRDVHYGACRFEALFTFHWIFCSTSINAFKVVFGYYPTQTTFFIFFAHSGRDTYERHFLPLRPSF